MQTGWYLVFLCYADEYPYHIEAEDLNQISNGAIVAIPDRKNIATGQDILNPTDVSSEFKLIHAQSAPCYISSDNYMFSEVFIAVDRLKNRILDPGYLEFWRLST